MGCNSSSSSSSRMAGGEMSRTDVALVKESWTEFKSKGDLTDLGVPMFSKLFEDYPDIKQLFSFVREGAGSPESEPFRKHARNVMDVVDTAVTSINDIPALAPVVRKLGAQHYNYGTQPSHLQPVGLSLLYAIDLHLGDKFTTETKNAWLRFYSIISKNFEEGLVSDGQ